MALKKPLDVIFSYHYIRVKSYGTDNHTCPTCCALVFIFCCLSVIKHSCLAVINGDFHINMGAFCAIWNEYHCFLKKTCALITEHCDSLDYHHPRSGH